MINNTRCKCGGAEYGKIVHNGVRYTACKYHWYQYCKKADEWLKTQYEKQWGDQEWFIAKLPRAKRSKVAQMTLLEL